MNKGDTMKAKKSVAYEKAKIVAELARLHKPITPERLALLRGDNQYLFLMGAQSAKQKRIIDLALGELLNEYYTGRGDDYEV